MNDVDLGSWAKRLSNSENLETATAYKVRELADKYVPFLSGNLASHDEVTRDDAGAHIIYSEPYAHRQFIGQSPNGIPYNYTKVHHPYAQSNWIEPVKNDAIDRVTALTKEAILHGTKS